MHIFLVTVKEAAYYHISVVAEDGFKAKQEALRQFYQEPHTPFEFSLPTVAEIVIPSYLNPRRR